MEGFQQGLGELLVSLGVMSFIIGVSIKPIREVNDHEEDDEFWE